MSVDYLQEEDESSCESVICRKRTFSASLDDTISQSPFRKISGDSIHNSPNLSLRLSRLSTDPVAELSELLNENNNRKRKMEKMEESDDSSVLSFLTESHSSHSSNASHSSSESSLNLISPFSLNNNGKSEKQPIHQNSNNLTVFLSSSPTKNHNNVKTTKHPIFNGEINNEESDEEMKKNILSVISDSIQCLFSPSPIPPNDMLLSSPKRNNLGDLSPVRLVAIDGSPIASKKHIGRSVIMEEEKDEINIAEALLQSNDKYRNENEKSFQIHLPISHNHHNNIHNHNHQYNNNMPPLSPIKTPPRKTQQNPHFPSSSSSNLSQNSLSEGFMKEDHVLLSLNQRLSEVYRNLKLLQDENSQ